MDSITIVNPATGCQERRVRITPPDELLKMFENARIAQKQWAAVPLKERKKALRRLQRYLQNNYQEFIDAVQRETGKVWADAMLDPLSAVGELSFWCGRSEKLLKQKLAPWPHWVLFNNEFTIRRKPLPVVGIISPWNLPLAIPAADFVPALFAGSAVVWKPSEYTPLTALKFKEVFDSLGCFPENLLQVAVGGGEAGRIVSENADVVLFTGSCKTGGAIEEICRERRVPYHLEMGGKAPFIVWPPANVERAANCFVWNACANAGHYCKAAERGIVASSINSDFIKRVLKKAAVLRPEIDYGPVITEFQLKIIEAQVADAVRKGAKILCGGKRLERNGRWFPPTVLIDVNYDMDVMTKETFGPLMPIMAVKTLNAAINAANNSHLSLNAAIFCDDKMAVKTILEGLEAGNPNVNTAMLNWMAISAPQCAAKWSTGPRCNVFRHGEASIDRTCESQTVVKHKFSLPLLKNRELFWYPYTDLTKLTMRFFIHAFYPFF